jgi:hypothetical protein
MFTEIQGDLGSARNPRSHHFNRISPRQLQDRAGALLEPHSDTGADMTTLIRLNVINDSPFLQNKRARLLILWLLAGAALTACGGGNDDSPPLAAATPQTNMALAAKTDTGTMTTKELTGQAAGLGATSITPSADTSVSPLTYGSTYRIKNNYSNAPDIALLSVSAFASAEIQPLIYGETYHLQNGYNNWSGGYLDTRVAGCKDNMLCVSTSTSKNRDWDSGSWLIKSADSKADGSAVMNGDRIFLVSEYPYKDGAYFPSGRYGGILDVRDSKCQDNILCVSTSESKNRDHESGFWTVEASGSDIYLDQSIHLKNVYDGSYLDVRGGGCQGNLLCVSTSTWADRDQRSGSWRFLKAHEIETLAPIRVDDPNKSEAEIIDHIVRDKGFYCPLLNFANMLGYAWAGCDNATISVSGNDFIIRSPNGDGYRGDEPLVTRISNVRLVVDADTFKLGESARTPGSSQQLSYSGELVNEGDAGVLKKSISRKSSTCWSRTDQFSFEQSLAVSVGIKSPSATGGPEVSTQAGVKFGQMFSKSKSDCEETIVSDEASGPVAKRSKRSITIFRTDDQVRIPYSAYVHLDYTVTFDNFLRWSGNAAKDHPTDRPYRSTTFGLNGNNAKIDLLTAYYIRNTLRSDWDWNWILSQYGSFTTEAVLSSIMQDRSSKITGYYDFNDANTTLVLGPDIPLN